jgi:hypothetical protein
MSDALLTQHRLVEQILAALRYSHYFAFLCLKLSIYSIRWEECEYPGPSADMLNFNTAKEYVL